MGIHYSITFLINLIRDVIRISFLLSRKMTEYHPDKRLIKLQYNGVPKLSRVYKCTEGVITGLQWLRKHECSAQQHQGDFDIQ